MDLVKSYINKMKILFITPHLSTGGGPQYLLKKIQELVDENDIYCVEYSNVTGGVLVVQRNQIEQILGNKLITLNENKLELIDHINNINPDIIHFEELPEYFCENIVSDKIYVSDRRYKIIETSHDSSFDVSTKRYFPDRFIFVSEYQKQMFVELNIPSDIVEYPIEYKSKKDRTTSLIDMGLDPNKIHILNVGLFTSRKNQSEIIEYARKLIGYPIQFHFVGNQADNFKWYWEPLMKDFPSNCKWWGERKDVDTFYNAMDVFLFTSRGTVTDKETNPLVIREAVGWNMPILMYNLPVYLGMYDKYNNIKWLADDLSKNVELIKSFLPNNSLSLNIWFESPNIIHILNDGPPFKTIVSVRDNHTKVPIYFTELDYTKSNGYYIIPIGSVDFNKETYFSEFIIEFYSLDKKLIHSKVLKIRELDYNPVILNKQFNPFDCLYINYKQMFYENIYKHCDLNDLNVVVDIGANVGLFSLYMIQKNCKKLFCIEPTNKAFDQLSHLLKDTPNVYTKKLAIHNFIGKSTIKVNNDNSTISGFLHDVHPYTHHNMTDEDVDVTTLPMFMKQENIEKVDLIKIDIEGIEYDVIDSMTDDEIIKSSRYIIEYHWAKTKNIKKIVNRFESLGYKITNNDDPQFQEDLGFFYARKSVL